MSTRRQFLSGILSSIFLDTTVNHLQLRFSTDSGTGFNADQLDTLAAVMDEIIPAGNGMPAAGTAGGPEYLQYLSWQYPAIREEISRFVQTVAQESATRFRQDFRKLLHEQRTQVLGAVEEDQSTNSSLCRAIWKFNWRSARCHHTSETMQRSTS